MAGRPMKEPGGDADQDEEVRSEERDAEEPGESSKQRAHGGHVGGMHHMQQHPHHQMEHHGNIHRAEGGKVGTSDGIDDSTGFHTKKLVHEPEGAESHEQEKKHGGLVRKRAKGGKLGFIEKEGSERHEDGKEGRPKRKRGGAIKGKKAAENPGRRRRAGGGELADLHPYTAAGKMSVPEYERLTPKDTQAGIGKDTRGGMRIMRD